MTCHINARVNLVLPVPHRLVVSREGSQIGKKQTGFGSSGTFRIGFTPPDPSGEPIRNGGPSP